MTVDSDFRPALKGDAQADKGPALTGEPRRIRRKAERDPAPAFAAELALTDSAARPLLHATLATIVLGLGCFVGWSMVSPVQELAHSSGEIVPSGSVRNVDHLEGGIVEALLVKEGQTVEEGQPLMRLAGATSLAERERLITRRRKLTLQSERLRAFAENRPANFSAAIDTADAADDRALLDAQIEARARQRAVLQAEARDARVQLSGAEAQRRSVQETLDLAQSKQAIRETLTEQGLSSRLQLLDVQSEAAAARAETVRLDGAIASLRETIAGAEAQLAELDSRLAEEALDKVAAVEGEIAEIAQRLTAEDDTAARLTVLAPVSGVVQELGAKTAGSAIQPGGMAARIVPLDDRLIAEVRIAPQDVGFVHEGQDAAVKVEAFDYARYGRIHGTIVSISPTTFVDEEKRPYYEAKIALDTAYVGDETRQHRLVPGMTLQADVVTGRKTVFQYLLKPLYTTMEGSLGER